MKRDDIIKEVEVYTVLFNPRKKKFKILDGSQHKIKDMCNSSNQLGNLNINI